MWLVTDHVCRGCFGRVLATADKKLARCADCAAVGVKVPDVCACGAMLMTGVNAGLRCVKNPNVSIECPAEIVVSYVGYVDKPEGPAKLKNYGGRLFDEA